MTSYAVIGASRGIGLEFVRQLANRPNTTVFAVVRNTRTSAHLASAVQYSNNVHVVEADVSDYGSLKHAAKQVSEITSGTLDCLIHNAALMDYKATYKGYGDYADMEELDAEFITAYKVNTLGVIHGISAFLPLLRASSASPKKIVVISSAGADHKFVNLLGMADTTAYGITKAAAVVATSKWAVQLKDEGFVVVSLLPGLVDTSGTVGEHGDSGSYSRFVAFEEQSRNAGIPTNLLTPEQSVLAQLKVIDGLKPSDNGLLLALTGGEWRV